jgi:adenylate cyclase
MAFWGAPIEDTDRIYNACHAVITCYRHLQKMNAEWQKSGQIPLPTRFGLHYGEAIVGNVGSYDRLNYTVIGDSVNLSSRLEGINKAYGTHILVSETIYAAMHEKFLMRPLDIVAVKGKEQGVRIFELLGENCDDIDLQPDHHHPTQAALTTEAFEYYLKQDWQGALEIYKTILRLNPTDQVAALYIERCQEFKKNPPPDKWDGVYHFKTK